MAKYLVILAISAYKNGMKHAAIILAAGKGTRMKSAFTKPLHEVGGRPMLAWAIDAARASGAGRIITILPTGSQTTQEWLDGQEFVIQDPPMGTGHAALMARDALAGFDGAALIMFADTPLITADTLTDLVGDIADGADVAVLGFDAIDPTGYGRLIQGDDGTLDAIIEQKDASDDQRNITLVNAGIMAVRTPLLFDLLAAVDTANASGELYLTDIVTVARSRGLNVTCHVTGEDEVMGVNDRRGLALAEALFQDRLRLSALAGGVSIRAPETVFLSADAIIGQDVIIEPHVVIGPGCQIGEGSIIKSFSHLEGARLGACCVIGPYARLRPGTDLAEGFKIGNFVETKNARMAAGAKANHLSYLGDSEIGSAANIGAGTITCNYDSYNKFRTLIGDGAFIGSNTALVAPVSIGAGAIVGAGSTVTQDVKDDDLVTTRAETRTVTGGGAKVNKRNAAIKQASKDKTAKG